jgi:pimeloyl-ACP methyl ester carboxylesterase
MINRSIKMRSGRKLEVWEYGDTEGHPVFFFHGLIGSHHQASYVSDQARRKGLRIIAPNRPGVGHSGFTKRRTPLEAVSDVEDLAAALKVEVFSVIGLSGGAPYALASLHRLASRIRTVTLISGMGPMQLHGALAGMDRRRRLILEVGSRLPRLAKVAFRKASKRFRANPQGFLDRLITTWSRPDQKVFENEEVYTLFTRDLHQVFTEGQGPEGLAQELALYRNYGFALGDLPSDKRVVLWHGLADTIVPPAMAWTMSRFLPNCEVHLVPGGHFVAVEVAGLIVSRLRQLVDESPGDRSVAGRGLSW